MNINIIHKAGAGLSDHRRDDLSMDGEMSIDTVSVDEMLGF